MAISFFYLFLAVFSHKMAIYMVSKSFIKKLSDEFVHFTSRKILITTIPLYLYSPTRTRCLKYFIYAVFRKSQKQLLKIFSYYIVYVLNLYLYGKICQCPLYNILLAFGLRNISCYIFLKISHFICV